MSIFGPGTPKKDSCEGDLSDYAKKTYVDTRDRSRVLRTGDTMGGDLAMRGNLVRGLPTTYPPQRYIGDEAVSWEQVVRLTQDSVHRVSSVTRRSLITVWAEEKGSRLADNSEWSFGSSSEDGQMGYPMFSRGRVLGMALTTVPQNLAARVCLVVNGVAKPRYTVTKDATLRVGLIKWQSGNAHSLGLTDVVNFKTVSADAGITRAIAYMLIELNE